MNIIDVLIEECRSSMRVNTFEINSVLSNPTEMGSLDRFSKAMYDYTRHQTMLENLFKLKEQIDEINGANTATKEGNEN